MIAVFSLVYSSSAGKRKRNDVLPTDRSSDDDWAVAIPASRRSVQNSQLLFSEEPGRSIISSSTLALHRIV